MAQAARKVHVLSKSAKDALSQAGIAARKEGYANRWLQLESTINDMCCMAQIAEAASDGLFTSEITATDEDGRYILTDDEVNSLRYAFRQFVIVTKALKDFYYDDSYLD